MPFPRWVLFAASAVVWLGLLCALPASGHTDFVRSAQAQGDGPSDEPHGGYDASCSAVPAKLAGNLLVVVCDAPAVSVGSIPAMPVVLPVWAPPAVRLLPLFLVHTALLI
jgi:hypothetical protein